MAEKTKELKFKCPECGGTEVEEVLCDVVQYSVISVIEVPLKGNGAYIDYDSKRVSHDGGNVSHYQCHKCGKDVAEMGGWEEPIDNECELREWIEETCPQEVENDGS